MTLLSRALTADEGVRAPRFDVRIPSNRLSHPSLNLTLFSGRAYSLGASFPNMTRKLHYYYYWCACTFASPAGGASGRNLRAC